MGFILVHLLDDRLDRFGDGVAHIKICKNYYDLNSFYSLKYDGSYSIYLIIVFFFNHMLSIF